MNYNIKFILGILLLITVMMNIVLLRIFPGQSSFTTLKFDNIQSVAPANFKQSRFRNKAGWYGMTASSKLKHSWIYLTRTAFQGKDHLARIVDPKWGYKRLKIEDNLYFAVLPRGKNFRLYVYILKHEEMVYWLESGTKYSTMLSVKLVADKMLEKLSVDQKPPLQNISRITKKTTDFVTLRYSQPLSFFLILINGSMGFIFLIILVVLRLSGLPPSDRPEGWIKELQHVSLRIRMRVRNQSINGCVIAYRNQLSIYLFKKLRIIIPFAELTEPQRIKIGKTFFFKHHYISFSFTNSTSVLPRKKVPVKSIKVTIYLELEKIRKLLYNTSFPFKEKLYETYQ